MPQLHMKRKNLKFPPNLLMFTNKFIKFKSCHKIFFKVCQKIILFSKFSKTKYDLFFRKFFPKTKVFAKL